MAVIDTHRVAWTYTNDKAQSFRVAALLGVTTQVGPTPNPLLGGSAAAATVPAKPGGWKMRRIVVRDLTNDFSRVVPVYNEANADILIAPVGTAVLNLNRFGVSFAYTYLGDRLYETGGRRVVD